MAEIAHSALKENVAWDSTATDDESEDERALLCIYVLPFYLFIWIFTEL